jgi:MarR family transcriptional regulator, organic hydroperoxide resistance regulator
MEQIQDTLGYKLAQLCKAHRNHVDLALRELDLHVGQEMILLQLWREDGVPQSHLVDRLCVEPPTVTKMLQRMEREELVERRPDPDDARVSRVYLTARGRSLEEPVRRVWLDLEQQLTAGLTIPEQLLLQRLLVQLHDNIS